MTRSDVVEEARSWLDTPYVHQAARKGLGADCIGLIGGIGLARGLPSAIAWSRDPRMHSYGRVPDPVMLLETVPKYLRPIAIAHALPGDILLFRWEQDPTHFAILSSPSTVIHSFASARKVCENSIEGEWRAGITWRSLIVSAWAYQEVTD